MLKEALEQQESAKEKARLYKIHGVKVNVAPSEKEFAEKLFDSLASIPTGRKAIDDMVKYGVGFHLETSLGTAGGYFSPENNKIVMAKSLGMDFMEFALVHEARHLLQNNLGRDKAEEQNLDYATRLMINRATEADAQTQAIKACQEWQDAGHDAPMKRFEKHYGPMINAYNREKSLSDGFKGWYIDERIPASYEQGYDVEVYLSSLRGAVDKRPLVSMNPEQISCFCGGARVKDFGKFLRSEQARKVHLLTKTAAEVYDISVVSRGAPSDESLKTVPVRDLYNNPDAQMYAAKYIAETRQKYPKEKKLAAVINAVEKINAAAKNGQHDEQAEKDLQTAKSAFSKKESPFALLKKAQNGRE